MKRHQELQNLSREHHNALQLVLKAKRAATSGDLALIEATATACLTAFHAELDPHFVVEETTFHTSDQPGLATIPPTSDLLLGTWIYSNIR